MNKKVLCVDDEPNILESYKRQLRKQVELTTAEGGEEGLKAAAAGGPFAVVVSDMMMPGMDGIQFLSRMREAQPKTVRIMLTGQANLDKAIEAVNEGSIFRFLTKPCSNERLVKALEAGIEQYRLVTAEKELLEKTLSGSVRVLMEVLSMVSPAAFGRGVRVQRIMRTLAKGLGQESSWEFDLAGMLSQIGCVTLPSEVLEKNYRGESLDSQEAEMFASHPSVGRDLIAKIPRLENIAEIIAGQGKHFSGEGLPADGKKGQDIPLGARALHAALDYDTLVSSGKKEEEALQALRHRAGLYDPDVLKALEASCSAAVQFDIKEIELDDLRPHMILAGDVQSEAGVMLIAKGQEVTPPLIARLRNFHRTQGVKEPLQVMVPKR